MLVSMLSRRNADLTLVRNRKAGKSARSRLKKADRLRKAGASDKFYEEIGKAIWGYLSHKLNIETSGLSRDVVIQELQTRGVLTEIQNELLSILDNSEFSRFAPTHEKSDMNSLYSDAAQLIRTLENNLK